VPIIARTRWHWDDALLKAGFFTRLARTLIPLTFTYLLPLVPDLPAKFEITLRNLASACAALFLALTASAMLNGMLDLYVSSTKRPAGTLKSYVQLGKLIIFAAASIAVISLLIDKSPLILLSGLGAMSAVLLLIFRDTLLSFVASVQLASNDMLRIGDWIEMPQVGVDGGVIDIALHTVTVQNWDKTITTIPTWRLISESFKNWRGMQQSGGRRIKRSLRLDTHSILFLDDAHAERLERMHLLRDYLREKRKEIAETNHRLGAAGDNTANRRRLTNIGTFRAYVLAYLRNHPDIHRDMSCMVRSLEPGPEGAPIELYCFTRTTEWAAYEKIQSDIFDHLLAILPEFGLTLFQNPSGSDLRNLRDRHTDDIAPA
jgi:miniconductance mechanosensitive channel